MVPDATSDRGEVERICDELERIYAAGDYPLLEVTRPWSTYNPIIDGELARPEALRGYLERELADLLAEGARFAVRPSRPRLGLDDPSLLRGADESSRDLKQKKLFLFSAERMELSFERLGHYTGTDPALFQRHVLLTNYGMHVEAFLERFPSAVAARPGAQMPAYHAVEPGGAGVSLVNIGVGPSNAKTLTDHVAVLRPDLLVMIGHCGGLRNHQEIGDFVLARTFLRADRVLDDALARHIPVISNHHVNQALYAALDRRGLRYRFGAVYTTADRNWELHLATAMADIEASRAVAVDMESATVAANGFRYRIPNATLLCVSDKPLHGRPKLAAEAATFYEQSKRTHVEIALEAVDTLRRLFPHGIPNEDIRSSDEPLMGGPSDAAGERPDVGQ
jgi:AMP nucleosidase